jgi:hypothetical protein
MSVKAEDLKNKAAKLKIIWAILKKMANKYPQTMKIPACMYMYHLSL